MGRLVTSARRSSDYYYIGNVQTEETMKESIQELKKKAEAVLQNSLTTAEAMKQEAEAVAREMVNKAHSETESIRQQAYDEGYSKGEQKAREDGQIQIDKLKNIIEVAVKERKRMLLELEPTVIALALKIAEKIIKREAAVHKDIVFDQVNGALNKLNDKTKVIIKVNLTDREMLNVYKERIMALHEEIEELIIVDDVRVEEGGCIIETGSGTVDARLGVQLAEIEKIFAETLLVKE